MIRIRDYAVGVAREDELPIVASFLVKLHELENGDETAVGADQERATVYLHYLHGRNKGICFVGRREGQVVGSIVLEFESPRNGPALVAAGGLYCLPSAPRYAAMLLMYVAALKVNGLGYSTVWLTAGTQKNKTRTTYEKLGFRPVRSRAGIQYSRALVADVLAALAKRVGRLKDGQHWTGD